MNPPILSAGETLIEDLEQELGPELIAGSMREPASFLAVLRERDPVQWIPGLDAWLVTRHEETRLLFSDRRLTADPRVYERYQPTTQPGAADALENVPFRARDADGCESLGRRLVSAALTPRAIRRMEAGLRELVEDFAAPLRGRTGAVDLMAEFTSPIAGKAIGRLLGVPPKDDDERRFAKLARKATRAIRPFLSPEKRRITEWAAVEIREYVSSLVRSRRVSPREDMISDLLDAAERNAPATDDDIAHVVSALVAAGTGTSDTAAARALRSLLLHPEQLALLRRDRSLLSNAVSELLRYDSGQPVMPRYVLERFDVRGRSFERGQLVLLCMLGANRDPRVFSEPDRLDLRRDTKDSLSFGQGAHYCIGANLAVMELRLMIEAALDFLPPGARILEDRIEWSPRGLMSQIMTLPVDFCA